MTLYELLDIRMGLLDRFNNRQNYWLTVTFAVFGALHFEGLSFDAGTLVVLAIFYSAVTLLAFIATLSTGRFLDAITQDVYNLAEREKIDLKLVDMEINGFQAGRLIKPINITIMAGAASILWIDIVLRLV